MPVTSGKGAGTSATANASLNLVAATGDILPNASANSGILQVPGLNHLTYVARQTSGVVSLSVQPQVAFRRGGVLGPAGLLWVNIAPAALLPLGGAPWVFHVNTVAAQAMRLVFSHIGQQGDGTCAASYTLSASG
jgi:hypothetical protein